MDKDLRKKILGVLQACYSADLAAISSREYVTNMLIANISDDENSDLYLKNYYGTSSSSSEQPDTSEVNPDKLFEARKEWTERQNVINDDNTTKTENSRLRKEKREQFVNELSEEKKSLILSESDEIIILLISLQPIAVKKARSTRLYLPIFKRFFSLTPLEPMRAGMMARTFINYR